MPDTPSDSRYRLIRFVTLVLLFAFAIMYGVQCVKNGRIDKKADSADGVKKERPVNDFSAFYFAGEQARLGGNIYEWDGTSRFHRPFEYPPLFAVFPMMPLSYFSYNTALAIYYAINVLLLAASFFMLRRLLWPPHAPETLSKNVWQWPLVGMLVTLAVSWRHIQSNTSESNANLYMLFLLTLAFYVDMAPRTNDAGTPRGGVLCGVFVAMATAVKLTPGLFGVYFLWARRGWSMLGGALGLVLWLVIVPGIFLGWEMNLKYLDAYKSFALGKSTGAEPVETLDSNRIQIGRVKPVDHSESAGNAGVGCSMRGVLTSLLTPSIALRKNGDRPRTVNIATLEPKQVSTIANILALILLSVTVVLTFSERNRRTVHTAALAWSLVVVTMVLISPLTRIAHLVVLAIPIATLVALIQQKRLSGAAKVLAPASLIALVAFSATNEYLHAIGATAYSLMILYVALAVALRNQVAGEMSLTRVRATTTAT